MTQTRSKQGREQNTASQALRDIGAPVVETRTLENASVSREYTVSLSDWDADDYESGCTNWSPDPSTITKGVAFSQTATDCTHGETRTRKESYVDAYTGSTTIVSSKEESQTVPATSTRMNTGTLSTAVCRYDSNNSWVAPITIGSDGKSAYHATLTWNGSVIFQTPDAGYSSTFNIVYLVGTKYSRGTLVSGSSYYICRG